MIQTRLHWMARAQTGMFVPPIHWMIRGLATGGLFALGMMAGCGNGKDGQAESVTAVKLAVPGASPQVNSASASAKSTPADPLHQTFKDATAQDPPEGQWLPESGLTKTGQSVGKLYETVVAEWDKIRFVTPDGKKLAFTATLTTDLGTVTIELWPDKAPNHVRNFIALARAGYYDGLAFDRAIKREDGSGAAFEALEGGCPAGSGEVTYGSIGYWLKPEFNGATHEPGTVGACHGEEVESAACKFYINLSKAEWMDGSFTLFGKVVNGLDVVRAIHSRPVPDDGINDRPVEPVVIRRVTISVEAK
jgi:peptidyl-prolyl cis-trans isomerase B (cyclophilin B)